MTMTKSTRGLKVGDHVTVPVGPMWPVPPRTGAIVVAVGRTGIVTVRLDNGHTETRQAGDCRRGCW